MNREQQIELLLHWARNAKRAQFAHYRMADLYTKRYRLIGLSITVITVISGSSVLADFSKQFPNLEEAIKLLIGLSVLLAGAMSGIQTFLRLDEVAAKHRSAGGSYSALKRHLDQVLAISKSKDIVESEFNELRTKFDDLGANTPQITDHVWNKVLLKMPSLEHSHYELDNHYDSNNK